MNTNASNEEIRKDANGVRGSTCNASSTFNFSVGAVAIIAAVIIGYIVYSYY